ncbi:hypothetical protein B8V81_3470 [Paenibacillus pasadenensis]|uniref:Uncharacterized protein n=1 Tax=Paenibacillus pasadenensis TaxID=217090 RepID=A0A2N5N431_9BACL|nr:hypothetical protein B8V81_3470 [Paenibacillus pasadenensis]
MGIVYHNLQTAPSTLSSRIICHERPLRKEPESSSHLLELTQAATTWARIEIARAIQRTSASLVSG